MIDTIKLSRFSGVRPTLETNSCESSVSSFYSPNKAAKMFLQTACLCVALVLVSGADPELDTTSTMKVKAFSPGHTNNPSDNLMVRCSFNVSRTTWVSLTKLKLYTSDTGGDDYEALASITEDKVSYGLTKKEIFVSGKYHLTTDYRTKLDVTWNSEDAGYCKYYMCVATGRDPVKGKLLGLYKVLQVDGVGGSTCNSP